MPKLSKNEKYADRAVAIVVTKNDVSCGIRGDPHNCVLAQAFRADLNFANNFKDIRVLELFTKVERLNGEVIVYSTPPELRSAIKAWDAGEDWKLKPGTYTFGVVSPKVRSPEQRALRKIQDDKRRAEKKLHSLKAKTIVAPRWVKP